MRYLARATFALVVVGWVVFRADSLATAGTWLGAMAGFGPASHDVPWGLVFLVATCLVLTHAVPEPSDMRLGRSVRWAVACAGGFFVAYLFMNDTKTVFLYYQF